MMKRVSRAHKGIRVIMKLTSRSCLCHFSMMSMMSSLQETYEAKRKEFLMELQRKEEEMRQMFVNKVKETEAELKEKEREVT